MVLCVCVWGEEKHKLEKYAIHYDAVKSLFAMLVLTSHTISIKYRRMMNKFIHRSIEHLIINLISLFSYFFFIYLCCYHFNQIDKLIISDPSELHDRSFMAHLNQLPWTAPLFTRKVEQTVLTGKHMTFCRVSNESISVVCIYMLY